MDDLNKSLDDFLSRENVTRTISPDGKEEEVCDLTTGECYVIKSKDGLIERVNKKYIIEDGRELLHD